MRSGLYIQEILTFTRFNLQSSEDDQKTDEDYPIKAGYFNRNTFRLVDGFLQSQDRYNKSVQKFNHT